MTPRSPATACWPAWRSITRCKPLPPPSRYQHLQTTKQPFILKARLYCLKLLQNEFYVLPSVISHKYYWYQWSSCLGVYLTCTEHFRKLVKLLHPPWLSTPSSSTFCMPRMFIPLATITCYLLLWWIKNIYFGELMHTFVNCLINR